MTVPARADEATATRCIDAAKRGQEQRDRGELLASRATFAACGDAACPSVVKRECIHWLAEVDERLPGIIVSVQDGDGRDSGEAIVRVDGQDRPDARAGRELRLDPGSHRFEAVLGGASQATEQVVVRERERGRVIRLVVPAAAPITREAPTRSVPHEGEPRRVPLATWILAGTAVAGGASFGYFWARGVGEVHDLRDTCAPGCSDDQVDSAARTVNVARVSLGVAAIAAVAAVVIYLVDGR